MEKTNELKQYIKDKIKYCNEMRNKEEYKIDKYSKTDKMTNEQMSGYYQGMGEWLNAILFHILKEKERNCKKNYNHE